jgi:hypothetical protein
MPAATTPRPTSTTTDQPQPEHNQQNYKRELDQAAKQHERQEEEREAVAWAAPAHLPFKPTARAKPTVWACLITRIELPLRADLTAWIELTRHTRPGLERWWPIVTMRPTKALAV